MPRRSTQRKCRPALRSALTLLALLGACSTRDEITPGDAPLELQLDLRNVVTLIEDHAGSDHNVLGNPNRAIRLSTGQILVSDPHMGFLSLFDTGGNFIRGVGAAGSGPGEFRHVYWASRCGATKVLVWDRMNARLSTFDNGIGLLSEQQLPSAGESGGIPFVLACDSEGRTAYQSLDPRGSRIAEDSVGFTTTGTIHVSGGSVVSRFEIPDAPGLELAVFGGGGGPRPLGTGTTLAFVDRSLLVGNTRSAAFSLYDDSGTLVSTFTLPIGRRVAAMDNYRVAIERLVDEIPGATGPAVRQRLLQIPMPDSLPYYSALLGGERDRAWVVVSSPGDGTTEALRFDMRGVISARLRVPVELEVYDIGTDYLLGRMLLPDGQPRIRLYRFVNPDR